MQVITNTVHPIAGMVLAIPKNFSSPLMSFLRVNNVLVTIIPVFMLWLEDHGANKVNADAVYAIKAEMPGKLIARVCDFTDVNGVGFESGTYSS